MSAASVTIEGWSPRRWLLTIAALALAQTGFLLFLSQRALPLPRAESEATEVAFINGAAANGSSQATLGSDPTLFALMDRHGFSGKTWLDFSLYQHSLNDWQEPARWLSPDAVRFGSSFQRYAAKSGLDRFTTGDQPPPQASLPAVASVEVASRTTIQVSRELADRKIITPLKLPSRPGADLLPDTVVQVVVNSDGDVLSARLLTSCGAKDTDQLALNQARVLRFEPLSADKRIPGNPWAVLTTANLMFHWHTVPARARSTAKGAVR